MAQLFCMIRVLCLGMILLGAHLCAAQRMTVYLDGQPTSEVPGMDSLEVSRFVNLYLLRLWNQGFVFSGLDSVFSERIYFHAGPKYRSEIDQLAVYDAERDTFELWPPKKQSFRASIQKQLTTYADNGYPFVRITWDSVRVEEDVVKGFLRVVPGPAVVYDSLVLLGEVQKGRTFLQTALNVEVGKPFSERSFQNLPKRIARLQYLKINGSPDVAFEHGKATVFLDLDKRKSSSFEGVVGLLPGQSAANGLMVTGFLDLQLANLFQSGKRFLFTWNRFADESQSLDLGYYHPFFLSSKLFLDVDFHLLKQDTTFLTQSWNLISGANIGPKSEIFFGYEEVNGTLISPDESNIRENLADFKSRQYMIGLRDVLYGQEMGMKSPFRYHVRLVLGDKRISKNPSIDQEAYDTLHRQTSMVQVSAGTKYLLRLKKQTALYHQLEGQVLVNDQILTNELARIGGLKSLRGFNENFFYASNYGLSRLELRQYFEEYSHFMLFYDQLVMEYHGVVSYPRGFGAGLSLDTSNGLFTFALAMGMSRQIRADPSNVKIHIGYTSRF